MPPSSGELWGHHLMPTQINVDCLMPNGMIILLKCNRDATLEIIKSDLWKEAKGYPLFYLLLDPASYIFVSITQDAEREEFYDETRRLCDLRLFQPILKLVEPKGNREEKMLNYDIGVAVGTAVNEFNEIKDLEVMTFRRNMVDVCSEAIDIRDNRGLHSQALYTYPPDIEINPELPIFIKEKLDKSMHTIVCIWVCSANGDRAKYTVKVPCDAKPETVIEEAIRKKTRSMHMTPEQQQQCIDEYRDSYLLKICGCDQYLLGNHPFCQYTYIRQCIKRGDEIPQLMLMSKEYVYSNLPRSTFLVPSYAQRGISALQDINNKAAVSLYAIDTMLRIRINCATYVNVKEMCKIYVKTAIYHGTESLCSFKETKHVESSKPRWNEWLDYDLYVPDIPRGARLCLSICCISKGKSRKKEHYALAWGNVNMFDFNDRLQCEKKSLQLWPMPQSWDDLLYPIGTPGSNPNKDSQCLEIEFDRFSHPVEFPRDHQVEEYARFWEKRNRDNMLRGHSPAPSSHILELERDQIMEIIKRDTLAEISEQEKELIWRNRKFCLTIPESLPKLLASVKWSSREDVAQLYMLLKEWPPISPETSMELLDCTYTDLTVRKFAVNSLNEKLSDEKLALYLIQLVQGLKFEPYLDNELTRFLLRRALLNQRIGHFFFWHFKSEMNQAGIKLRFGMMLEAYCRGCGAAHLKSITRQVEALQKLTMLTDKLKSEREDDQVKLLYHMKQPDYLQALQQFSSPLNSSQILGELKISDCRVMSSKKRPLMLAWNNPDPMAEFHLPDFQILFKNGDDLRQDMLTLQMFSMMQTIWQDEGLDLRMIPYGCLSVGKDVGLIEVVRRSKTIMSIQKDRGWKAATQFDSTQLHKWIKEKNKGDRYNMAIDNFTRSCAGYCVATFVLGIGDRHPDNIMVNEEGQVFHVDFGHFLNHRKKKFGYNRERVPFVLTEDFITVVVKGQDMPLKTKEFNAFTEMCGKAYLALRKHANIFITLFCMMLSCGIPELQSLDDIGYLRKTLAVDKSDKEAIEYFQSNFFEASNGSWTTKMDWFCHWVKNRK